MSTSSGATSALSTRLIWRWHFYAGLVCLPFIIVLSLSGTLYLFRPQIETVLNARFDHLSLEGQAVSLDAQVAAARAAMPAARFKAIELRNDPTDATRVHVLDDQGVEWRIMVRPDDLAILDVTRVNDLFVHQLRALHGEVWLGDVGAMIVEWAASWAIVLIVTGLYLWWPRGAGLAGVLYPRLGGARFLRDLHAVTGIYLSIFALFLLLTGLPWTKVWGEGFREARRIARVAFENPDWSTGPADKKHHAIRAFARFATADEVQGLDQAAARGLALGLASPVYLSPPVDQRPFWQVHNEPQNRALAHGYGLATDTLEQVAVQRFEDKPWIDRMVAIGVAIHEGRYFGPANVALGLMTAGGYGVMATTSLLMWTRRRPKGVLGAPLPIDQRLGSGLVALIIVIGVLLPLLGLTLLLLLPLERFVLRRIDPLARFLGLALPPRPGLA